MWALVKDGDVALTRGSWLSELARGRSVLPRRQDLPRAALLAPEAIFRPSVAGSRCANVDQHLHRQVEIVVVSYCWLTAKHPDPKGDQLQLLGRVMDKYLQSEKHNLSVFIDWCSLHQDPRTATEQLAFERSLE